MLSLGQTLYLWREARDLTQAELARLSGISRPNLSTIERGRDVTVATLRRLARPLGIRPGVLVDGLAPHRPLTKKLSRECLDRIARWVAGERIPLTSREREIARTLGSLVKRKIGLSHGSPGRRLPRTAREEKASWLKARAELGPAEIQSLLNRIQKISGGIA